MRTDKYPFRVRACIAQKAFQKRHLPYLRGVDARSRDPRGKGATHDDESDMTGPDMTIAKDDLTAIAADLWARLQAATRGRHPGWHTPVVGTADGDLRVMVLRGADAEAGALRFHTDARSPKAALIGDGAPVSLLFYDAAAKLQLRCAGTGRIGTRDPVTDAAWAGSSASSRRCYLAETAPSSRAVAPTSGLPAAVEGRVPTLDETEAGRANFATLIVTLLRIDWLYLAHEGHRRALFERNGSRWDAGWLVP